MWINHQEYLRKTFLVAALLMLFPTAKLERFYRFMGPFRVVIRRITNCPPSEKDAQQKMEITLQRYWTKNRNLVVYDGNVSMPFHLNDTWSSQVVLASWSDESGWSDNANTFNFKAACKGYKILAPGLCSALRLSIFGDDTECPFYPGLYRFKNFTPNISQLPFKHFEYGRWRGDAKILDYNRREVVACIRAFVDTLPL